MEAEINLRGLSRRPNPQQYPLEGEVRSQRSEAALKKKIARNLREAPEEKSLPNHRLQRSVLVVYVSGSDCVAWAADSSILPLVLLLSPTYISGGGGVKLVPF